MVGVAKYHFKRAVDIDVEFLASHDIRGLLLDIDNTLTRDGSRVISPEIRGWLDVLQNNGIKLCILSNNKEKRISDFAESVGLPFIPSARKPLAYGAKKAFAIMGVAKENAAIVGDQIFTDILCADFSGCVSILVDFFEVEKTAFFKVKRFLERPFVAASKRRKKS